MIKILFPNNKKFKDLLIKYNEKIINYIGNNNAKCVEQAFYNLIDVYKSKKNKTKRNKIKLLIKNIGLNKEEIEKLFLTNEFSLLINKNNKYVNTLKNIFEDINISNKWNYFRKNKINEILYEIFKLVDVRVCPYCNRNYLPVIKYSDKILSPEMDHFYPKEKYPYLAFSLYNLVPICSTCNSRLKRSKDINLLHPYKEGFEDNIKFKLHSNEEKNYIDLLSGSFSNINLYSIELIKRLNLEDTHYIERCKNSNNEFHIRDTYNIMHKQDAIDLVRKIALFRPSYMKSYLAIVKPKICNFITNQQKNQKKLTK